ncbi:hypothetical protein [Paenibacillus macquariensis]|nr:hypothetical protein [Paenibacillus macquariensis]MEC0090540.1 hypothetical protein [Paenibacillus macquariensis]
MKPKFPTSIDYAGVIVMMLEKIGWIRMKRTLTMLIVEILGRVSIT